VRKFSKHPRLLRFRKVARAESKGGNEVGLSSSEQTTNVGDQPPEWAESTHTPKRNGTDSSLELSPWRIETGGKPCRTGELRKFSRHLCTLCWPAENVGKKNSGALTETRIIAGRFKVKVRGRPAGLIPCKRTPGMFATPKDGRQLPGCESDEGPAAAHTGSEWSCGSGGSHSRST